MGAPFGEVPERLNGTVSKTVVTPWATVGSNPTLSAKNRQVSGGFLYNIYQFRIQRAKVRLLSLFELLIINLI
jgi:hypothetical protein